MVDFCSILSSIFTEPSNLIAFCALIVSGLSFFLTIYTIRAQQIHDRLSVKPLADIHLNNFPGEISITVKNDGLGPMIIKSIETFREEDTDKKNLGWPPSTINKLGYHSLNASPQFLSGLENSPIQNGNSVLIFKHFFDITNPSQFDEGHKTRDALKELTIKIKYTNIFEKEQFETVLSLKNLKDVKYL